MRRFIFDPALRDGDTVVLSSEESLHISKVLRLRSGAEIELLDGIGGVYRALIVVVGSKVKVRLVECILRDEIPDTVVQVAQAMLKGKKMELVVQKCTELGAVRFMPFFSSRCQGKIDKIQENKRHARWGQISLEACKQSMRTWPMIFDQLVTFEEYITMGDTDPNSLRLLFWEEEKDVRLHQLPSLKDYNTITILLGPEGGITEDEIDMAREKGWRTVSLGKQVLRAETATLSALSIVQHLAGNM